MKKAALFLCLFLSGAALTASAQDDIYEQRQADKNNHSKDHMPKRGNEQDRKGAKSMGPCRKAYIGFSLGFNNPAGVIGLDIDVPVVKQVSVSAGFGASTWGNKLYIGGRYYTMPCHRGWAFGAGITHNTGQKDFQQNMETLYGREDVILDLDPQTNAFFSAYYFWTLGRRANRLFVEAGYSVPFASYSYKEKSGDPLNTSSERALKILSPHGLMIGVGFSFGMIK